MDDSPVTGLPEPIVLWQEEEYWVIRHERTGVTTQGKSRLHALLMLVDALTAYTEEETDVSALADDVFETEGSVEWDS